MVNSHGDPKSPNSWGYSAPSKWPNFMASKLGVILTTYKSWDDPPSGCWGYERKLVEVMSHVYHRDLLAIMFIIVFFHKIHYSEIRVLTKEDVMR